MGSTLKPTQGGSERKATRVKRRQSHSKSGYYFMNFATFIDFLNCLYINEVEDATRTNNHERIATMVFEGSFEGDASADPMVVQDCSRIFEIGGPSYNQPLSLLKP